MLRTVSPTSFAEDPLRLVRALRFVSQLGFEPDESTLRADARRGDVGPARLRRARRRRSRADGMGELSKLLLGKEPARALRIARDTGVLVELLPEFERAIGFDQESRYHSLTVDEHTFAVVQAAADAGHSLAVRLAALFHDLGKPHVAWRGSDGRLHYYAKPGARRQEPRAGRVRAREERRSRGCAIRPRCVTRVERIVRHHMFSIGKGDALRARRFLAKYGDELAFDLIDHKEADYRGKPGEDGEPPLEDIEKLDRFRRLLERERKNPHRLADLAVNGNDLIELGFTPGPRARPRAPATCSTTSSTIRRRNTRDELLGARAGRADREAVVACEVSGVAICL